MMIPVKGLAPLSGVLMMMGCQGHGATAIFQDVGSSGRWEESGHLIKEFDATNAVPQYVVENGRLYVLIQVTEPKLLYTKVNQPTWSREEVEGFKKMHPELDVYFESARWVDGPR